MNAQQLTSFQTIAEKEIVLALEQAGLAVEQREVLTGTIPFYSKEPQTAIHITARNLEVWLFGDEANLLHNGRESRFEEPDFDSSEELREALLNEIRSQLAKH